MATDYEFCWWFPTYSKDLEFGLRKTACGMILLFIIGTDVVIEEILLGNLITNISKEILSAGWEAWKTNHF